ncbi:MAG: hypothetical protein P1P84_01440 [Deferrisomatales bacterium]|nr:hypothetical protein [Deferrisomatales bacterium]
MRTSRVVLLAGAALAGMFVGSAAVASEEGARLCALTEVLECSRLVGCERVLPADVGLPDFLRVAGNGERISTGVKGDERQTAARIRESVEGATLLGGIENARAWSAALSADGSQLTGVVSEPGGAFVLFASCTGE